MELLDQRSSRFSIVGKMSERVDALEQTKMRLMINARMYTYKGKHVAKGRLLAER